MGHHHNAHHEPTPLELYEGDQSKLYSGVLAHHDGGIDSAESKKKVKKIWMITLLLSIITIFEVGVGLWAYNAGFHNYGLITYFLVLTLVKAFYITKIFMHLGDEKNFFVWLVIGPLFVFLWVIFAYLSDGAHGLEMNQTFGGALQQIVK